MLSPKLILTADGSHSIRLDELDENYHSVHGAIQESIHVFIKSGFHFFENKKQLSVLEIGFGTGLNALLTAMEAERVGVKVNYSSLEKFPLQKEIVQQLNYPSQLKDTSASFLFQKIHEVNWNEYAFITETFRLKKQECDIYNFLPDEKFDLIYFDAFGPRVQPEMWTSDVFNKIYDSLLNNGILVTYCAKGEVKRTLKAAGFKVETLQGPPGKREMIRAQKVI